MTEVRPLELSDLPLVKDYLRRHPPEISELTFTNLFVWRHSRPVFFVEVQDTLFFLAHGDRSTENPDVVFGHPLGDVSPDKVVKALDMRIVGFVRIPARTANV